MYKSCTINDLDSISLSTKIHRKISCQCCHGKLYCDFTLYLAVQIDSQLRLIVEKSSPWPNFI